MADVGYGILGVIPQEEKLRKYPNKKCMPEKMEKGQENDIFSDMQIFEKHLKEWSEIDDQIELAIDELSIDNYKNVADKIKKIIEKYATKRPIEQAKASVINSVHSLLFSKFGMEGYNDFINDEDGKCFLDLINNE